jgi:hypothetical protein
VEKPSPGLSSYAFEASVDFIVVVNISSISIERLKKKNMH